jgi:CRP/FNR family cyclic AMP-dependent transcriptional regulator
MSLLLESAAERRRVLGASAWFTQLPPPLAQWVAETARLREAVAGARLFARGDAPDGMYFVASGAVRVGSLSADGRESLLLVARAPQWFGEAGLFDHAPRAQDAWAGQDSRLLHLPQHEALAFLGRHPEHWQSFGWLLAHTLRLALGALEGHALLSPARRLAQRLVAMAYGYAPWQGPYQRVIPVQQDDLGIMLAMSRQTINQLLKEFEAQGCVRTARGAIEVLDMGRLKAFAQR